MSKTTADKPPPQGWETVARVANDSGDAPIHWMMERNWDAAALPQWLRPFLDDNAAERRIAWGLRRGHCFAAQCVDGLVDHGRMPNSGRLTPAMAAAIEDGDNSVVRTLLRYGGRALADAPTNAVGCTPLLRALDRLIAAGLTAWVGSERRLGVVVALLKAGADQDTALGGTTAYELVDSHLNWDAPLSWHHGELDVTGPRHWLTVNATLRPLWATARLQRLWRGLKAAVALLRIVRSKQQEFKERYYAPRGAFEQVGKQRFDTLPSLDSVSSGQSCARHTTQTRAKALESRDGTLGLEPN